MIELPLGRERCIHCHEIVPGSETYRLNGQGPLCEPCTNDAKCDFENRPDGIRVERHHRTLATAPRKG